MMRNILAAQNGYADGRIHPRGGSLAGSLAAIAPAYTLERGWGVRAGGRRQPQFRSYYGARA